MGVSDMVFCKGCGAAIVFVKTVSGARMPCDANRVDFVPDFTASTRYMTPEGIMEDGYLVPEPCAGSKRGLIPHHISCPNPPAKKVLAAKQPKRGPSVMKDREGARAVLRDRLVRKIERAFPESFEQLSLYPVPISPVCDVDPDGERVWM